MSDHETKAFQRVSMDFTLPLWGVLTVLGAGAFLMIGMYFNVASLTTSVKELQITVQAGNTAYSSLASRATLLEFRVDNNASDIKRLSVKAEK